MTKKYLSTVWQSALLVAATGMLVSAPMQAADLNRDQLTVTCSEYISALQIADPGKSATKKQKERAASAQDDLSLAMFWLHGYLLGRDHTQVPLNRDWMVEHVGKLAKSCQANSPDGSMRLVDAATKL